MYSDRTFLRNQAFFHQ